MMQQLKITLDRNLKVALAEQIRLGIEKAIISGVLQKDDRLPSWSDLANQLGVSRGTVKIAYEKLCNGQFVTASRSRGTRVVYDAIAAPVAEENREFNSFMKKYIEMTSGHGIFQSGVPAKESFPSKLFLKIRSRSLRNESSGWLGYSDPSGEYELRREISIYLALSRGIQCTPDQVLITSGFSGGLGLTLLALNLSGEKAWVEDPGFPFSKQALKTAKIEICPIPVDQDGIDVDFAIQHVPDAGVALITPGQQAPLGMPLSLNRRVKLLEWAKHQGMWIIEDDYLGELQLDNRAAPALFSLDQIGRVIYLGSFSKTLSPRLKLGFAVVPKPLINSFKEVTATLAPAPTSSLQYTIQEYMHEGHFLRHLRHTRRIYSAQRNELIKNLKKYDLETQTAGLSVLVKLQPSISDQKIAREALQFGLSPSPLSDWYMNSQTSTSGLILGVATAPIPYIGKSCERLFEIIKQNHHG